MSVSSKYFLITLLFAIMQLPANAQQCGYEGKGAYIIQVKDFDTDSVINGLQLKLVYNKNRIAREIGMTKGHDDVLCEEPYLFWQANNIPTMACSAVGIVRVPLGIAGDNYLCIVPLKNDVCALSAFAHHRNFLGAIEYAQYEAANSAQEKNDEELAPQYFLRVHIKDVDGKKNGGVYDDAICKIPIASLMDICATEENTNTELVTKELRAKTLVIRLKKNSTAYKPMVFSKYFDNYLVPFYDVKREADEIVQGKLAHIGLYSELNGKNVQLIYPPETYNANKIWNGKTYEMLLWQNARVQQNRMFRVPCTNTNPNARSQSAYMYYGLNPQNKLYHVDTLFNNKENVYYNEQTHQITATDYTIGDAANFITSYKLVNDKWQYSSTERIPHQQKAVAENLIPMPHCIIDNPMRKLRLQFFDSAVTKVVCDTFWITNIGKADAFLKQEYASNFVVPEKIKAGDRVAIIYRRMFLANFNETRSSSYGKVLQGIEDIADVASIRYFNAKLDLGISYSIIRSDAIATDKTNRQFEIAYQGKDIYVVHTNDSGFIASKGAQTADGIRYGIWFKLDTLTHQLMPHQELKEIKLHICNADIKECKVQVINGWSASTANSGTERIFINKMARTITVSNDSASIIIPINFENAEQNTTVYAYLLKPNEDFMYQNKVKVPCNFKREKYIVKFDERWYLNASRLGAKIDTAGLQNYFNELKSDYPRISFGNIKARYYESFFLLDLNACTSSEIENIKSTISSDENIRHLDFVLIDHTYQHFDNTILIYNLQNLDLNDEQLKQINKNGFVLSTVTSTPACKQYHFTYKSKIADKDFLQAYNTLNELLPAFRVSLNIYAMPVPENIKE
jgi:hypothetical protein